MEVIKVIEELLKLLSGIKAIFFNHYKILVDFTPEKASLGN